MLTGPAGIGKTTACRRLAAALPESVTRATGSPIGHIPTPALWPWRQVARSLARRRPGGDYFMHVPASGRGPWEGRRLSR